MMVPILVAAGAFIVTVPWGDRLIRALLARGIGKNIRAEEPDAHQRKAGTATMGGVLFLGGLAAVTATVALAGYTEALLPLGAMLAYALLGAFDDLRALRDAEGVGWLARHKFVAQWGLAFVVALALCVWGDRSVLALPLSGRVVELGWGFVPLAMVYLVFTANAVNFTDGLDGLAGGTSAIVAAAFAVIAFAGGQVGLSLFAAALVGVLLAFLWFNVHPAGIFMGDVGSEALGAGLVALTALTGQWLILPVVGVVFVAEALSVMAQVAYFKYTRRRYGEGRRILRMSPLHYHFELGGMSEVQVTLRFWIVTAVAALAGVAVVVGGGR